MAEARTATVMESSTGRAPVGDVIKPMNKSFSFIGGPFELTLIYPPDMDALPEEINRHLVGLTRKLQKLAQERAAQTS